MIDALKAMSRHRSILTVLAVANLLGALYGFTWYRTQLATSPWYVWPLIPDSPLSALLFSLVLLGVLAGRRVAPLEGIACISIFKYGLWTVAIIGDYWRATGALAGFEMQHLLVSHSIMALQGIWFIVVFCPPRRWLVPGMVWAAANDVADYGFGLHPALPLAAQLPWAQTAAVALTISASILMWVLAPSRAAR